MKKNTVGVIILSNVKAQKYWDGKAFNTATVKQYHEVNDALTALQAYWFGFASDARDITIRKITQQNLESMRQKGVNVQ